MNPVLAGLTTALVLLHLGASPVAAQEATARDSVIAVVDESLRAMAANDVAASRLLMLPDGVEFSTQETPEGVRIRRTSNEEYLEWLAQNEDVMLERVWDPTVQVHGTIATLLGTLRLLRERGVFPLRRQRHPADPHGWWLANRQLDLDRGAGGLRPQPAGAAPGIGVT